MKESLELHLFFNRIMMEHAFFINVFLLDKDIELKKEASTYYNEFSNLLEETINLSKENINKELIEKNIIVTKNTKKAEEKTMSLTKYTINTHITEEEYNFTNTNKFTFLLKNKISKLNKKIFPILNNFVNYKEKILDKLIKGNLYMNCTQSFIQHMINEARMYQRLLTRIEVNKNITTSLLEQELFWNESMKEHTIFIKERLDLTEINNLKEIEELSNSYEDILDKYSYDEELLFSNSKTIQNKLKEYLLRLEEELIDNKVKISILPIMIDHYIRELNYYNKILEENTEELI